jgi:hypothetical protein
MRWRWLIGDYAAPDFRLTRQQRREISFRAQNRHVSPGALTKLTLLCMLPCVIAMMLLPTILGWLGYANQNVPHIIALALIVLLIWPLSAWIYSSLYGRACRRAMRDLGYEICVDCGYSMRGLDSTMSSTCPECGRRQPPMRPPAQP